MMTGWSGTSTLAFPGFARRLVRGTRAPLVGIISMDLAMADVTGISGVEVGDVATIFGTDGEARICPAQVARELGTVTSDLLCGIGKRVPRRYVR